MEDSRDARRLYVVVAIRPIPPDTDKMKSTKVQTLGAYSRAGHASREKAGTREANGLDNTRMRITQYDYALTVDRFSLPVDSCIQR